MDGYNAADVVQKIMEALQKEYKELKKMNVMIVGKTGVGKSTLINNMFNEKLAETGVGRPITNKIRKIEKDDYPLAIYDTPGLELGGDNSLNSLLQEVKSEFDKGVRSGDVSKAIHCIWYCVSTTSHRFEEAELKFVKRFLDETGSYNIPVIIVLTQSYSKKDAKELKNEIEKENLKIKAVVPVLSADYELNGEYIVNSYGLDNLAEITNQVIPEAISKTFVSIQSTSIKLKKAKAQNIVKASALVAFATGTIPIPFSDATLLIPNEITMLASITAVFRIPIEKATMVSIISGTIGIAGTTVLGKSIVSGLLKLIPGVGSIIGGVISGTAAASLTSALGEAYIIVLIRICEGQMDVKELGTAAGRQVIEEIFFDRLKIKRDSKGAPVK